jgi:hypothetical protein
MMRSIFGHEGDDVKGGRKLTRRASRFVLLARYYQNDQINEDEVGRTCVTHGTEEKCIKTFSGET